MSNYADRATVADAPWVALPDHGRRLSMGEVRRRCATLPTPKYAPSLHRIDHPRRAALLVPIVDIDGEAAIVATKRPSTMIHHRGDWVFPGGRLDETIDRTTAHTAVREAHEELGVPLDRVEIVGRLTTRGPIVTGFVIDVFVGITSVDVIDPDPSEVAEVAVLKLSEMATESAYGIGRPVPDHEPGPRAAGSVVSIPKGYPLRSFTVRPNEFLWGTQGDVLHELLSWLLAPAVARNETGR